LQGEDSSRQSDERGLCPVLPYLLFCQGQSQGLVSQFEHSTRISCAEIASIAAIKH